MTPKRKAYLAKCSEWEVEVRNWIKIQKQQLRIAKTGLGYGCDDEYYRHNVRKRKRYLMMYRHELQRLKGMDRVVVPKRAEGYIGVFVCSCGSDVIANYCPNCGRRILWEKVK